MTDATAPLPADATGPVTEDTNTGTVEPPVTDETNTGAETTTETAENEASDPDEFFHPGAAAENEVVETKTLNEIAAEDPERFFHPGKVVSE